MIKDLLLYIVIEEITEAVTRGVLQKGVLNKFAFYFTFLFLSDPENFTLQSFSVSCVKPVKNIVIGVSKFLKGNLLYL